jgi:hypothetical protein
MPAYVAHVTFAAPSLRRPQFRVMSRQLLRQAQSDDAFRDAARDAAARTVTATVVTRAPSSSTAQTTIEGTCRAMVQRLERVPRSAVELDAAVQRAEHDDE